MPDMSYGECDLRCQQGVRMGGNLGLLKNNIALLRTSASRHAYMGTCIALIAVIVTMRTFQQVQPLSPPPANLKRP